MALRVSAIRSHLSRGQFPATPEGWVIAFFIVNASSRIPCSLPLFINIFFATMSLAEEAAGVESALLCGFGIPASLFYAGGLHVVPSA